jgi:hypothetical protein
MGVTDINSLILAAVHQQQGTGGNLIYIVDGPEPRLENRHP